MRADRVASTLSSRFARLREFWSRVYRKSAEDKIFFMASAISYNVLIAVVPLFLLAVGVWGYVLSARYGEPSEAIIRLVRNYIPEMGGDIDLLAEIESGINSLGGWGTDLLGIPEDLLGSTQRAAGHAASLHVDLGAVRSRLLVGFPSGGSVGAPRGWPRRSWQYRTK